MSKGFIFTEDGEVEVLEHSVEGGEDMYCPDCEAVRYHALVAISSLRGNVYMCTFCGRETD
ncbi:MAG: hypothetical protein WB564_06140 [Dehalococcoidia bacterium]